MTLHRPTVIHRAVILLTVALVGTVAAGCDRIPGLGSEEPTIQEEEQVNFGACFRAYGSDVLASSMSRAGNTMLYLTTSKPETVPNEAWDNTSRAVVLVDLATGEGRYLILPWPAQEVIPVSATTDPTSERTPSPYELTEQMVTVSLSETGDRTVVGVRRVGVQGIIAKLYAGVVPTDDTTVLEPGNGLTLVPINDFEATEGIRSYTLSPDGTKLAAVVGSAGEVRTYDFNTQQVSVYTRGPKGNAVIVTHELPLISPVSTLAEQSPAVANQGVMIVTWAPQGDRLAVATDVPVNDSALAIMDIATGKLTPVRRFKNSTVPQVAWAADGQSLFVMTTDLKPGQVFGNTAIRQLAAVEGGKDITKGGQIVQPQGYNTEPANLVNFGDDQRFLFTWQSGLWRLTLQGGDLTTAAANKVSPNNAAVPYYIPAVSMDQDTALFLANTGGNQYATMRLAVSQEACAEGAAGEVQPTTEASGTPGTAPTPVPTKVSATTVPTAEAVTPEATTPEATGGAGTAEATTPAGATAVATVEATTGATPAATTPAATP